MNDTCAFWALSELQEQHADDGKSLTVLDLLRCIFSKMGDRPQVADPWLQKPATMPSRIACEAYEEGLRLFKRREIGRPKPARTVKQIFKADPDMKAEAQRIRQEAGNEDTTNAKILSDLFDKTAAVPGGLDRFEWLACKDLERYAKETKHFTEEVQKKFDEENGLLPLTRSPPCRLRHL